MSERKNKESNIKALLQIALGEMGLATGFEEQQVINAFKRVMPPSFLKYIIKMGYNNGIFSVKTNSASLKHELVSGRELIIRKINEDLKEQKVKELRVF
ncbi:MAG: DUF721 domain-containing protein [Chitinophagales bacterium]|nr:DUF721 domain-containing protein [Chitinophagales bacterium]